MDLDTTISIRLDPETYRTLLRLKDENSLNISDFVRKAIAERLERARVLEVAPAAAE